MAFAMPNDVMRDVLEGKLGRIFSTPVGQSRTDRLGVFEAGYVVTAEAPIFRNGLAADVLEPLLVCELLSRLNDQILLGALQLALELWRNAVEIVVVGDVLVERLIE